MPPRSRERPGVGAVEAVEDVLDVVAGSMPGPWSATLSVETPLRELRRDLERRVGRRVDADVGEQVADHLAQPILVAADDHVGLDLGLDRPLRLDGAQVEQRVVDQLAQGTWSWRSGRPWSSRASSSRSSTSAAMRRLSLPMRAIAWSRPRRRPGRRRGTARSSRAPRSAACAARAMRRRRTGAAASSLRSLATSAACWLSKAPWIWSSIVSNACAQPADLGAVVGHADALGQVAGRDALGGRGRSLERPQVAADDEPADDQDRARAPTSRRAAAFRVSDAIDASTLAHRRGQARA